MKIQKIVKIFLFAILIASEGTVSALSPNSPQQVPFPQNASSQEMERIAMKVLKESINHYNNEEYWQAAQGLVLIMDYYPQFKKLDQVITYLGKCLFQEELFASSTKLYNYLLKKFPRSSMIPEALLGLENNYYYQKNYKQALRVYFVLIKRTTDRKIINEASYIAGQCHFNLQNYDMAIGALKKIDSKSEYYASALYTTALCYLKKSNVATSVEYFRKITGLPIINEDRRNTVDNARLTLGLIYYELQAYKAAIHQLSKIAEEHDHYQDALLAMGWCYLKLEEHENVIKVLSKLVDKFPESENAEEAYFVLGQSYIALERYDDAIASYKKILEIFPEQENLPLLVQKVDYQLQTQHKSIENLKTQILIEETKLLDALPLNAQGQEIPDYLIKEKQRLQEVRQKMIENLRAEKDRLVYMQQQIAEMKKLIERRKRRKDWRGYAEYGVSRALFLKELGANRGN